MGCLSTTCLAEASPVTAVYNDAINPKTAAITMLLRAKETSRFLKRYQALTQITNIDANAYEEEMVCKNLLTATGERNTSQKFTISFRAVSGLNCIPAGNCIHPLATKLQSADRFVPTAVTQVANKWRSEERRVGKECRSRW